MKTTGIGKELAINIREAVINLQQSVTEANISENFFFKTWSFEYNHNNYDDENLFQWQCTLYSTINHIKEQIQLSLDRLHEVTLCILKENRMDLFYPYITEFLADITGYDSRQNQYFNWPIIQLINNDYVIKCLVREFIYQFETRFFDTVLSGELGKIIDEIKNTISPKRQEAPPQLPPELSTPEAMKYWKKAQEAGLIDDKFQFTGENEAESALFAECFSERLKIKHKWKHFQTIWNVNDLAQIRNKTKNDCILKIDTQREKIIKNIFVEFQNNS